MNKLAVIGFIREGILQSSTLAMKDQTNKLISRILETTGYSSQGYEDKIFKIRYGVNELNYMGSEADYRYTTPILIGCPKDLEQEFVTLLEEKEDLQKEYDNFFQLLRVLLNECETLADVHAAMPMALHQYLPPKGMGGVTLTDDALERIKRIQTNDGFIIGNRLVINLLLQ